MANGKEIMPITADEFRDCLRHFPAGVTIVTIKTEQIIHGLTVSAFASVSPEPPLIMVIIDRKHNAFQLMEQADAVFAVNILGQEQQDMSDRFAWLKDEDRFQEGDWQKALTGAPVLQDAVAWLDCTIYARYQAGTHQMYVGEVQASSVLQPNGAPLIYWNRDYRQLDLD